MDGISSFLFFPATTKSGTKKSFGVTTVSLTKFLMAAVLRNLLWRFIVCMILIFKITPKRWVFLMFFLKALPDFLFQVDNYIPIAQWAVSSLKYFLFFRWFLSRIMYRDHVLN